MFPAPLLTASRLVSLVSISSLLPIPVAACNLAVVPVMFAVSAVRLSLIAPAVAVTSTVLCALRMLNATFVPAV